MTKSSRLALNPGKALLIYRAKPALTVSETLRLGPLSADNDGQSRYRGPLPLSFPCLPGKEAMLHTFSS